MTQLEVGFENLLPAIEIETAHSPEYSIIWLHGLGADGNDFVPIVNQLDLPLNKSIRFVFPHASERSISINNGYVMRAWYDILNLSFNEHEDESGIRNSQKVIEAMIAREIQRGIPVEKIVLAGFSQGGAMALQVGLHYTESLAGIMALSCYLPLLRSFAFEVNRNNLAIPIFMAHGIGDDVIPISYAIKSREVMKTAGFSPEWHEYSMGHNVSQQEMQDISRWIHEIIKP
ncbi:MAG: alpha/beta hydrolase [Nitrosomonas sp.]|nr:alpha/beta hydrolase [Nitrosomonas sp.]